jgi:hypothetical protein
VELYNNAQLMVSAPFLVLNAGSTPANRPPNSVTGTFDPPLPDSDDVIFCRVNGPLLADPDYDLVRFRFDWRVNGASIRVVTNAAYSDAIARGSAQPGDVVTCVVTPSDGEAFGIPVTQHTVIAGGGPRLGVQHIANLVALSWPTSLVQYAVQHTTDLTPTSTWARLPGVPAIVGAEHRVTNAVPGRRFYRLIWP